MSNRKNVGLLLALITSAAAMGPVLAQAWVNPYGHPYYNNYAARGYAPCGAYGYCPPNHAARNAAIGAGVGAAVGAVVGLLASHHNHNNW
jgi:hypothetical protein